MTRCASVKELPIRKGLEVAPRKVPCMLKPGHDTPHYNGSMYWNVNGHPVQGTGTAPDPRAITWR